MTGERPARDSGAGLIGTIGGLTVFLTLLTFAVQLLFNLYATSAVTAVAHDAATSVATSAIDADDPGSTASAVADAEAEARQLLGEYGQRAVFTWDIDSARVRLTIAADHPKVALSRISSVFGLNRVERTVEVRVETAR